MHVLGILFIVLMLGTLPAVVDVALSWLLGLVGREESNDE